MKAIQTRYLGPTTHRPARIKAWAEGVSPIVITRGRLPDDEPHRAAAVALCRRYGWNPFLQSGTLPNGDGCHVFSPERSIIEACIPDLDHYARTHGPGPDRRLAALRQMLTREGA